MIPFLIGGGVGFLAAVLRVLRNLGRAAQRNETVTPPEPPVDPDEYEQATVTRPNLPEGYSTQDGERLTRAMEEDQIQLAVQQAKRGQYHRWGRF